MMHYLYIIRLFLSFTYSNIIYLPNNFLLNYDCIIVLSSLSLSICFLSTNMWCSNLLSIRKLFDRVRVLSLLISKAFVVIHKGFKI